MQINKLVFVFLFTAGISIGLPAFADGHGHDDGHAGHEHDHSMHDHSQHSDGMNNHLREVMGHGRVNKIMADKNMINIKHEPIPEMNWPQMNMNFRTDDQVDLKALKPGQEVDFKLLVDDENNYVVKEITAK
jgi:Cu/Ag efflux protein CusF